MSIHVLPHPTSTSDLERFHGELPEELGGTNLDMNKVLDGTIVKHNLFG